MVLKLHRYAHQSLDHTVTPDVVHLQPGPCVFQSYQRKARLHGEAQVSIMDVHVSSRSPKRVCIHESMYRFTRLVDPC